MAHPNFPDKDTAQNLVMFFRYATSRNKNSGASLPNRHKETVEGFDIILNPL